MLTWKTELSENPTPVVIAIEVEPPVLWTPILSLVLLGATAALGVAAFRGRRPSVRPPTPAARNGSPRPPQSA